MAEPNHGNEELLLEGLLPAAGGYGPLLQRDYWALIAGCKLSPPALMQTIAARFCELPPDDLVRFSRTGECGELALGEAIDVRIRLAGVFRVRVVHRDAQSLTLATLAGHPEAGRITFGAYRNPVGRVVFHIRSRARSSTEARYLGFMTAGEPMQTSTWTDFVAAVAFTFGDGVDGAVHVETRAIDDEDDAPAVLCSPTFIARGG